MKKAIELIEKEIEEINTGRKLIGRNAEYANAAIYGLERAIELIKVQAATEVVEGSIMHGKKKYREGDDDDDLEDKSGDEYTWECNLCGAEDGKCDYRCPNNDSPYAQLIQNGYD